MSVNLPNTIWLTLVADNTTPDHLAGYAGTRLLLSEAQASAFPQPGVHDSFNVLGADIYGYVRDAQDGNGGYEWVMESTPEPIVLAVQAIPANGWTNPDAGAVFVNLGRELLARGSGLGEVAWALKQLYNAARADV